jgi:hypothetical protein
VLKFDKFGGQIPALDVHLLPPENAVYAENAFLQAGRLEPLAADVLSHIAAGQTVCVPRTISERHRQMVDSYWLEFTYADTYVVRSPVTTEADGGQVIGPMA